MVLALALGMLAGIPPADADTTGPVAVTPTRSFKLTALELARVGAAPRLSRADREAMLRNVLERRERTAALVDSSPPSPPGLPPRPVPETNPRSEAEFHGTPSDLQALKNVVNPIAQDGSQSAILEPTTVNEGKTAIYTGNWFVSYSTDGGATWTEEAIPAGSANAPFFCCDIDTV